MARVKVFTDRGWIEIPPPYTDISVIEDKRFEITRIRGSISFTSTNEYLSEYGEQTQVPTIESREKGKWIDSEGKEVKSRYCAHCSICGGWSEYLTDFCGNCGAYMRTEAEYRRQIRKRLRGGV